jgi:hypothetical protein
MPFAAPAPFGEHLCFGGVLLVKRGDIGAGQELLRTAFARVPQNAFSMLFTPFLAEIAEHFSHSLDWARRQGALSWELRTSTSLARRELRHGGNPIATWRASNVADRNDPEPTQTDGSEQMKVENGLETCCCHARFSSFFRRESGRL